MVETQLTDFEHQECEQCGESVVLQRDKRNGLVVGCDCADRSVKVKRAVPFSWS